MKDRKFIVTATFKMSGEVPERIPEEYIANRIAEDLRCETQFSHGDHDFEEYFMAILGDERHMKVDVKELVVDYGEEPFCEHCGENHSDYGATINIGGVCWCLNCVASDGREFTDHEIQMMSDNEKNGLRKYYQRKLEELGDE